MESEEIRCHVIMETLVVMRISSVLIISCLMAIVACAYPAENHCAESVAGPQINCETAPFEQVLECKVGPPSCVEVAKKRTDLSTSQKDRFTIISTYFHNVNTLEEFSRKVGQKLTNYDQVSSEYWNCFGNELTEEEKKDRNLTKLHACRYLSFVRVQLMKDNEKKDLIMKRCGWVFEETTMEEAPDTSCCAVC